MRNTEIPECLKPYSKFMNLVSADYIPKLIISVKAQWQYVKEGV